MKVTLDLTKLLEEGRITREEHDRLHQLGAAATGSLAFNILLGFGVVAVSAGLIALVPNAMTAAVIGLLLLGAGLGIYAGRIHQWEVLAHICVLVGALALGGASIVLTEGSVWGFLAVAGGFTLAGILARSGLLVVLGVLAFSSSLGARTGYMHAAYFFGVEEPTLTIIVFSGLALATYRLSKVLPSAYERLALQAARASVLLVNLAFWIGSLWGDSSERLGFRADESVFIIAWAAVLLAVGVWAARENRRWVVSIAATFFAIHFYTQWFERLGASPASVLLAGLLTLGLALTIWRYSRSLFDSGRSHMAQGRV